MTATLSPPVRIAALVGILAAIALGVLFYSHNRSSSSSSSAPTLPTTRTRSATKAPATHATAPNAKPTKVVPKIVLLPGLPAQIARALRYSKVVVVSVYSNDGKGDKAMLKQARMGAKQVHAGFAAVNVQNERTARSVGTFVGTTTAPPATLVVARPGKVVNRFDGWVDAAIVAQAARDAGAGR